MDDYRIQPFEEWNRRPSWHGSYDDYVRHMQDAQRRNQAHRDEVNNQRIAELVAEKLKNR